jgi:Type II secretory pathway, prepilin signal peptidase PulO and related peptidases
MIIFVTLLGLLIGSFLNVCIYRIPRNESIAFPPSHCTSCNHKIKAYDLIPVVSWIILRGKCRSCGERISIKYPLIEALTCIVFALCYIKFGLSFEFFKYIILLAVLIAVTFIDFEHSIIPGSIMIFTLSAGIILNIVGYKFNIGLLNYLYGLLAGGGVILLIVVLTGGMGGGDIQLMAVIGLFLGFKLTILTLLLSFIIGGVVGVLLILLKIKSRKDYIPFGPWISLAAFVSIFLGNSILNWYMSLL